MLSSAYEKLCGEEILMISQGIKKLRKVEYSLFQFETFHWLAVYNDIGIK